MANSLLLVALIATISMLSPSVAKEFWESTDAYYPAYYGTGNIDTSASAEYFFEYAKKDTNNTFLTLDDFLKMNYIYEEILTSEKARLALVDTNNDGKAMPKEQEAYVQKLKADEKNAQLYRFQLYIDTYDKGDGKMQAPELELFMQDQLNLKPKENVTAAEVLKPFDSDNDGALTAEGVYDFMMDQPVDQLEECDNGGDYSSSTFGSTGSTDTTFSTDSPSSTGSTDSTPSDTSTYTPF